MKLGCVGKVLSQPGEWSAQPEGAGQRASGESLRRIQAGLGGCVCVCDVKDNEDGKSKRCLL